jgi:hypothetical protein
MRTLVDTLKKNPKEIEEKVIYSPIGGRLGMQDEPKKFKEWFDLALLPDFSKVEKYFDISVYALSASADGISLRFYSPVPPGLK